MYTRTIYCYKWWCFSLFLYTFLCILSHQVFASFFSLYFSLLFLCVVYCILYTVSLVYKESGKWVWKGNWNFVVMCHVSLQQYCGSIWGYFKSRPFILSLGKYMYNFIIILWKQCCLFSLFCFSLSLFLFSTLYVLLSYPMMYSYAYNYIFIEYFRFFVFPIFFFLFYTWKSKSLSCR